MKLIEPRRTPLGNEDVMELAAYLCGIDPDDYPKQMVDEEGEPFEVDLDEEVEGTLLEKFDIDLPAFRYLMTYLLPMCDRNYSPITDYLFRGFSTRIEGTETCLWLLKQMDDYN